MLEAAIGTVNVTERLKNKVYERIDLKVDTDDAALREIIEECVCEESRKGSTSIGEREALTEYIFNAIRKLDILQELLEDDAVTEIMVNGQKDIFIEKEGRILRWDKAFESNDKLHDIAQRIAAISNKIVNESVPIVDTRLQDGSRVNIVLPPVAIDGPVITIRKFYDKPLTMEKLIEIGSISEEAALFLKEAVRARHNIFISGGTGSGKTTFLNILSNYIQADERVVTIEDSAELQIRNIDNIVRLEARTANVEGKNAVTIRELIRASLRIRPDRIIVGEVRGAECFDMIQAMNTGHDGSLSTGHGNSTKDMMLRLESMVLMGVDMPVNAIRQQIASAIDLVVHLGRLRDKSRRVLQISEVVGVDDKEIRLNPLFKFEEDFKLEEKEAGKGEKSEIGLSVTVKGELKRTGKALVHTDKMLAAGIGCQF